MAYFLAATLLERCHLQFSRLIAFLHADKRPIFSGFRSVSIAHSYVWLGLPIGRFQSVWGFWIADVTERWWSSSGRCDQRGTIFCRLRCKITACTPLLQILLLLSPGMVKWVSAFRWLTWSEGWQPLGSVIHSSDEPGELSQCHPPTYTAQAVKSPEPWETRLQTTHLYCSGRQESGAFRNTSSDHNNSLACSFSPNTLRRSPVGQLPTATHT